MTDRALLLAQLHAAVDALTRDRRTVEHVTGWTKSRNRTTRQHAVVHPPLLAALAAAAHPARRGGESGARQVPGSRPPVNLDAVDRLREIEREIWKWRQTAQIAAAAPDAALRMLDGQAALLDADALAQLAADARRWQVWAETTTGERQRPWSPDAPCPVCDQRHGLRVALLEQRAYCRHCEAWWDDSTLGLLAAHVARTSEARVNRSA